MTTNAMRVWLDRALPRELKAVSKQSGVTIGTIRQIAGGYRTDGKARTTPETARLLEIATIKVEREGLTHVNREELCPACGVCEFSKQCRKETK